MNKAFEKILERLEENKSIIPVNRVLDDIIKDKPKELGQLIAYDNSIKIVKEVAEEYKDGWIPCTERLPENENYILLSFENFSVPMVGRYEEDETGGAFYIGDEDETCISQDLFVNAWQPLPEPLKESD